MPHENEQRYLSVGDAAMRLNHTIIRDVEGEPLLIYEFPGGEPAFTFRANRMLDGKQGLYNANDRDLDISSIPLGFVSSQGIPIFFSRHPYRRQKQGYDYNHSLAYNTILETFDDGRELFRHRDGFYRDFRNCVVGSYPSFSRALTKVKDKTHNGEAFARALAVIRKDQYILLNLCGENIGVLRPSGFLLKKPYSSDRILRSRLEKYEVPLK